MLYWMMRPLALHHFCTVRTMYSTWGLDVFRSMTRTSRRLSFDSLLAMTCQGESTPRQRCNAMTSTRAMHPSTLPHA